MTATTNHRRWLITGVSSGLGRALAEHVLDHGDTVMHFRTQGHGHVINVGSVASTIGLPWAAMYSASKGALPAWSDALAAETASFGIKLTCLQPGGLRTNFASSSLRSVRRSLPEYAESVAAVKHRYAAAAELMPNDPRGAAVVIAGLVELDEPPVRAAQGEDAHSYVTSALQRRISGYANDRSWTTATAFETAKAR